LNHQAEGSSPLGLFLLLRPQARAEIHDVLHEGEWPINTAVTSLPWQIPRSSLLGFPAADYRKKS
jgi:hypothetical protein